MRSILIGLSVAVTPYSTCNPTVTDPDPVEIACDCPDPGPLWQALTLPGASTWIEASLDDERTLVDLDGDQQAELIVKVVIDVRERWVDVDENGTWDVMIRDIGDDGTFDEGKVDTDGDGDFDVRWQDANGDGVPQTDEMTPITPNEPFQCPSGGDFYVPPPPTYLAMDPLLAMIDAPATDAFPLDVDQDGSIDFLAEDADGDGVLEALFPLDAPRTEKWGDQDHDGAWDTMVWDDQPDGTWDGGKVDTDGDGDFDVRWQDGNGDGRPQLDELTPLDPEEPFSCPIDLVIEATVDQIVAEVMETAREIQEAVQDAVMPADTDFDGFIDAFIADVDGDGTIEFAVTETSPYTWFDVDDDGSWDTVLIDKDGDGTIDGGKTDVDRDGDFEHAWEDSDGDEWPDPSEVHRMNAEEPYTCPITGTF